MAGGMRLDDRRPSAPREPRDRGGAGLALDKNLPGVVTARSVRATHLDAAVAKVPWLRLGDRQAYVRTHDFSTMGVAPGRHLPHDLCHCMIDIPSSMPLGHWELTVIANGITSDDISVQIATPHEDHRYFGKVETMRYNRFGDFDGFTLETKNGAIHGFESHEPRIGELARRAWQERTWIEAKVAAGYSHKPAAISFLI